jgi:hypothetical protein
MERASFAELEHRTLYDCRENASLFDRSFGMPEFGMQDSDNNLFGWKGKGKFFLSCV